jgi:polar amino acid transport system substrate-binding protein
VFREDVRDLEAVRDLSAIQTLADLIPERVGSPLSTNALRGDLEVSHRAVAHWIDVLERLYHLVRILRKMPRSICGTGARVTELFMPPAPSRPCLLAVAVCVAAILSLAAPHASPTMESQTEIPMSAAVRAELAPNGRLRAALNYGNFLLVSTRAPEHTGVAPDLARELARRAGATLELVGYANAGLVADAAAHDAWDVAFIGAEPARAGAITFSPAYVEIEATYLVPASSPLQSVADVDRPGVRIASGARAAYTLFLQRSLTQATVTEVAGIEHTGDWFARTGYDAVANLKPRLAEDVKKGTGVRMLDGRFTAVQQSMAVRKERRIAAAYLAAFADEIKKSGLLASLIEKHRANGLLVAR